MQEKRYPIIDEEDGYGCMKASEPMEAVAYNKAAAYDVEDDIEDASNIIMPFIGPSTCEEAIARIEEAEREIENGEVYDWEDVLAEARQRARKYEAAIY
jgi:hypothetical protein